MVLQHAQDFDPATLTPEITQPLRDLRPADGDGLDDLGPHRRRPRGLGPAAARHAELRAAQRRRASGAPRRRRSRRPCCRAGATNRPFVLQQRAGLPGAAATGLRRRQGLRLLQGRAGGLPHQQARPRRSSARSRCTGPTTRARRRRRPATGRSSPTTCCKLRKASLADAARTMAQLNLAMADAFIAAWSAKYSYSLLRPVTYVQLVIDSNWVPTMMDTPPFPEYPSAHSVQSSAAAGVLEQVFGATTALHRQHPQRPRLGPARLRQLSGGRRRGLAFAAVCRHPFRFRRARRPGAGPLRGAEGAGAEDAQALREETPPSGRSHCVSTVRVAGSMPERMNLLNRPGRRHPQGRFPQMVRPRAALQPCPHAAGASCA